MSQWPTEGLVEDVWNSGFRDAMSLCGAIGASEGFKQTPSPL